MGGGSPTPSWQPPGATGGVGTTSAGDAFAASPPSKPSFARGSVSGRRAARIAFSLPKSGRVRFVVTELSPVCRRIGSYAFAGRAGLNRVPLHARVGRHRLAPGTYRVVARLGLRELFGLEIVVSRGRVVRRTRLAAGALGDPCRGTGAPAAAFSAALQLAGLRSPEPKTPPASVGTGAQTAAAAPPPAATPSDHPGAALGTQFTRVITAGSPLARALVLAAVALAIALLGTAALPDDLVRSSPLGTVVVRRRIELALAGASTLLVAVLAYLAFVA